MTSETARRIALLASPGPASERLRDALRSMGGDLVLNSDPAELNIAELQTAAPQAVVVLLDPGVEDAIEMFNVVLSDPAIDVLYEEADVAVSREGWDVARWSRHLAAKLLHHGDVLPPRGEFDSENRFAVVPGPTTQAVPAPVAAAISADVVLATADQAQPTSPDTQAQVPAASGGFDPVAAEYASEETLPIETESPASDESLPFILEIDATQADTAQTGLGDFNNEAARASPESLLHEDAAVVLRRDVASPPVDAPPVAGSQRIHDLADLERRIATMELVATSEPEPEKEALSGAGSNSASDLNASELSASELNQIPDQVADSVPAQAGAIGGALLILAGIGGPDAVRQLLGKLPASFPRPVLVQQRLDGGRHDRLVQQMSRTTELPVHLAEIDVVAEVGHVYILPPALGIVVVDGRLHFAAGSENLIACLPASDSAVLMLSGSDDSLVEAAMAQAGEGAFVAGQSSEGCYDSTAATALVARGGRSGQPADLAVRALQFWAGRG